MPAVPSDQWLHLVAHIIIALYHYPGSLASVRQYSVLCKLTLVELVLGSEAAPTKYKLLSSWRLPSTLQMALFVPTNIILNLWNYIHFR